MSGIDYAYLNKQQQEYIDLKNQIADLEDLIRKMKNELKFKQCHHSWPDGSTAINGAFMMNECQICHWDDL